MTITGYSNAIVDAMLGWLKGLANWVLRLFNLAGSASASPLLWLSQNWLKLLIVCLVIGVGLDLVIWLIRWRPYWVWFRKERVIVNDDRFFENADMDPAADWEEDLLGNWDEHDYVVASTVVKRQQGSAKSGDKRGSGERGDRQASAMRRRSARVERHVAESDGVKRAERPVSRAARSDEEVSDDSIFTGRLNRRGVAAEDEDEVFNVSNLPEPSQSQSAKRKRH